MAMQKKIRSQLKSFYSVALYREDLDEILELFAGSCSNVKITDNDYEYSNFDEVKTRRGQQTGRLAIESDSPMLSFSIGVGQTALSHGGSDAVILPFTKIEQLLKSRRRAVLHAFFNFYVTFIVIALILGLAIKHGNNPVPLIAALPIMALLFIVIGGTLMNNSGVFSKIIFVNQLDQQGFWAANKDKIWLMFLAAIIGGVATKLVPFLLSKLGM
jgi:hypothetical protein